MKKLYYICKYTPIELLEAMGAECVLLDGCVDSFSEAEREGHPNLCGYGKAIIEKVISENIKELVLVNCCDTIRSVYDILLARGDMEFLYFLDLVHDESECASRRLTFELKKLYEAYKEYSGNDLDPVLFEKAFQEKIYPGEDYAAILGARVNSSLEQMMDEYLPYPVRNLTCVSGRNVVKPDLSDPDSVFRNYAAALISQMPCMRMNDISARKALINDPHLKAIVYHTVKFCDYYGFEYSDLMRHSDVPVLKLETDYTLQSVGQLSTRLEAFAEQLTIQNGNEIRNGIASDNSPDITSKEPEQMKKGYFAGIDSGSTSTKAVIINSEGNIVSSSIIPTGAKVSDSSTAALNEALAAAGLSAEDISDTVTTGYGRKNAAGTNTKTVTEISCHAKGAHALFKDVRTIIDIGGQDSKVISVDENGNVISFAMNDKCAAGTGRFLEMTGRALGLNLEELGTRGIKWKEDIAISNTCTVFAESEIISLVAENKSIDDIVHGLNRSVAVKISSLMKRVGQKPAYMMTGGVAANRSVVAALSEMLKAEVATSPSSQLAGAYGAALFALGK